MKIKCHQCNYEVTETNENWSNKYAVMFCKRCNEFVKTIPDVKLVPIHSSCLGLDMQVL